ncbi:Uncharacterised protein [Klebsiella pneumoniae]|nr:Uncharacterised protein [Klebsiella pneumoniae]
MPDTGSVTFITFIRSITTLRHCRGARCQQQRITVKRHIRHISCTTGNSGVICQILTQTRLSKGDSACCCSYNYILVVVAIKTHHIASGERPCASINGNDTIAFNLISINQVARGSEAV